MSARARVNEYCEVCLSMFHFLRRAAQTWVAKLLLLLLVASFGIWGVSRELISGGNSTTVVTVGDQKVGVTEFQLAYQRQVASIGQQFGMRLTPEQARARSRAAGALRARRRRLTGPAR